MTPVIRIDDQVMEELKNRAIRLGLVFETPNSVLRAVLGIPETPKTTKSPEGINPMNIVIEIEHIHSAREYALIPVPKNKRAFFPGFKVDFELLTDVGVITTHITSAVGNTPIGHPTEGKYIQTGLRTWYDNHPELNDGSKLRIDVLEPGKRYRLS